MIQLRHLSIDDLDHFVTNYYRNLDEARRANEAISVAEGRLEQGAGSLIKLEADRNVRMNTDRMIDKTELVNRIIVYKERLAYTCNKIQIVNRITEHFAKADTGIDRILDLRKKGMSYDTIAERLQMTRYEVRRILQEAYAHCVNEL